RPKACQANTPRYALFRRAVRPPSAEGAPAMTKPRSRKRDTTASIGVYDAERDILDLYLHEVARSPLLTPAQEIAVARRVRAGDEAAMEELVTKNLRFVISV